MSKKAADNTTFCVEYTDMFAGEANYSWVRRATFPAPNDASNALLVRRAKKALNLCGWPTRTDTWGEMLAVRPRDGAALIMFIFQEYV